MWAEDATNLYERVEAILREYETQVLKEWVEDGEHSGLSEDGVGLVDVFTPEGESICVGEREVEALAGFLVDRLDEEPATVQPEALEPFIGFDDDPADDAILVFARGKKEAARLTAEEYDAESISVRPYAYTQYVSSLADAEKLEAGIPHVVRPPLCQDCGTWGLPQNEDGICESCQQYHEEEPDE